MKKKILFLTAYLSFSGIIANAQLTIGTGSSFTVQAGGVIAVAGNIESGSAIGGSGKLVLKGTGPQQVNMNGTTISNLEMDNPANASLGGNAAVANSISFSRGKITLGDFDMRMSSSATSAGGGTNRFIETNGNGKLIREVTANISNAEMPLGAGSVYRPAFVTTNGTYNNATVAFKLTGTVHPNNPAFASDYIRAYWPVAQSGITGSVNITGQYDLSDIAGTETYLRGHLYNNPDWNSQGESHDNTQHRISMPLTSASAELTATDKFNFVNSKVFLQGAYTANGVMADKLRTLPAGVFPLSDPYRTLPYSANFQHVNNAAPETISSSLLNDFGNNNNIVDWVFLELRNNNASPGNTVVATRSALLRKDGSIVDVDGSSPVIFNRVADGNYTLAIRHRNHLAISTDPASYTPSFTERKSTMSLIDFSTLDDARIYGPASAYTISADGKNMMWGGNANANTNVRYTGISNDKDYLLVTTLGNNTTGIISNVYHPADVNMNKTVRFSGLQNDKDFLLINVLGNNTVNIRSQSLPN